MTSPRTRNQERHNDALNHRHLVYRTVAAASTPLTVNQVASRTLLGVETVRRFLHQLEADELVARTLHPHNGTHGAPPDTWTALEPQ